MRRCLGILCLVVSMLVLTRPDAGAQSTLERLKKDGVIRMGLANEAPWSFAQTDGAIVGADHDLAVLIFNRLGIPRIEGVLTQFGSLIPGLKANRFDVIVAGLYIRPERCKQVIFSQPTAAVGDAVVVLAGNPKKITSFKSVVDDPSLRLGGVVGAATAQNARAAGVPDSQITMFPDFVSAVVALKAGRIDGALQTAITAQTTVNADPALARAAPFQQAIINGKPAVNYAAFAFRPEEHDLVQAFNAELAKVLGTPEYLAMVAKYGLTASEVPKGVTTDQLCGQ
jgi:polar amino acid transport system substrate-binding protein